MKAIIFDLDGVIVSTDDLHYKAWKQTADKEGIFFNREINERLRGVSRMESLNIILERATTRYSAAQREELAAYKNNVYIGLLQSLTPLDRLDGVTQTLAELRNRGYKLAIGSSSKNAPVILDKIGYGDYFDAVSDGNNITRSKPDPEVFLCAADMLGALPEECLVVEDADAGIKAAADGGFVAAGIGSAANSALTAIKLNTFSDLLEFCPSLTGK